MPAIESLTSAQRATVLDSIGATRRMSLKQLQADLAARFAGARAGRNNPRANGLYPSATAPTITVLTALPASNPVANALPPATSVEANFRPYIMSTPGWRVLPGSGVVSTREATTTQPNTNYAASGNAATNCVRYTFFSDDPKPIVEVQGTATPVRVIVDDQYVDMAGIVTDAGNSNGTRYLSIDFTQAGALSPALAIRKIQVETTTGVGRVVRSSKAYTVFADAAPGPRLIVQGDSWATGTGATLTLNSWSRVMGDWLGLPMTGANALGGTGIASPNSGGSPNTTTSYGARLPDLERMTPDLGLKGLDILVVGNITNDYSLLASSTITQAQYQTSVTAYLTNLRAAYPDVPIVVVTGATQDETVVSATTAEDNIAAIIAGMKAAGDTRIAHVRATKPANASRSWLYGTGNTGAPTGDGNRDFYIGTVQAAHANDAGMAYYGRRAASEVYQSIMGMQ